MRLHKLIYVWECMTIEDAGRLDPPTSWALILSLYKLLWIGHDRIMEDKSIIKELSYWKTTKSEKAEEHLSYDDQFQSVRFKGIGIWLICWEPSVG